MIYLRDLVQLLGKFPKCPQISSFARILEHVVPTVVPKNK